MADMDKWHGKLKGKIVLLGTGPLDLAFPDTPLAHRYTDAELAALVPELLPTGGAAAAADAAAASAAGEPDVPEEQRAFTARAAQLLEG